MSRVYTDVATFELGADGVRIGEVFGMAREELARRLDLVLD